MSDGTALIGKTRKRLNTGTMPTGSVQVLLSMASGSMGKTVDLLRKLNPFSIILNHVYMRSVI